jgi:ankyrin repeat protein
MLELLLSRGADANAASARRSALHGAAEWGHADAVSVLLRAGACPTAVDADGVTVVEAARKLKQTAVVSLLESETQSLSV